MSYGTRRNGSNKFGPFTAAGDRETQPGLHARGSRDHEYSGRHASPRRKTARARAGKAVPAAAAAATLAAGAAAYILVGGGSPQASPPNAAMARPGAASAADIGKAHGSASTMINAVTTAQASVSHSGTPAARHTARPAAAATANATVKPTSPASAASPHAASTLSCDLSYSLLPQNVTAIVSFLLAHGYSDNAAAGIAGNIYQESKGDPESEGMGGGGLIGWTPLRNGMVTGDPAADLQTQLAALLDYNEGWASYLPLLNSAASPADAAYIDVIYFERAGIPAASTREASATNVALACGI